MCLRICVAGTSERAAGMISAIAKRDMRYGVTSIQRDIRATHINHIYIYIYIYMYIYICVYVYCVAPFVPNALYVAAAAAAARPVLIITTRKANNYYNCPA